MVREQAGYGKQGLLNRSCCSAAFIFYEEIPYGVTKNHR